MTAIYNHLKIIARRWNRTSLLSAFIKGVVCGALPAAFLLIVARFVPILYSKWIAAAIWLLCIVMFLIIRLRNRMTASSAAKLVDVELGDDAVRTALTLPEEQQLSMMGKHVVEHAAIAAERYRAELKQRIPWQRGWNARLWMSLMGLTIVIIGSLFIMPNEQDAVAKQMKEQESLIAELEEELQHTKDAVEQAELEEQDKEQLLASLDELLEQLDNKERLSLSHAQQLEEALKELKQLEQEKDQAVQRLEQLNDAMEREQSLQQLQQSLEAAKDMAKESQQQAVREALKQLTSEQADALAQLARELKQLRQS